jgi:hypothetical protein
MLKLLKMFRVSLTADSTLISVPSVDITKYTGDWIGYLKSQNISIDLHPLILAYNNITSDKLTHEHYKIVIPNLDVMRALIQTYNDRYPL